MKIALLTTDSREHYKDYKNPQPYFGTALEALLEGFKLFPDEAEIHVVSCLQQLPISSPQKLANNIYYHPLHVPKWGWMRSVYLGCSHAACRKLQEIQPDIVHGQGTERDCAISAIRSGFPNVLTIHGNMRAIAKFIKARRFTFYWLAAHLEKLCLKRTNGCVAISTYTQANVAPFVKKSWLLPNAVHPSFFEIPRNPATPPRLLCVANINQWKNQIALIHSLDKIANHINFELRFLGHAAGEDSYTQEFHKLISERSWCHFLGFADRKRLQKELSTTTALALPSLEDNCPMVILEASAAGVPTVGSCVGGVPDLISDGETGLLFDPHDREEMANTIHYLLAHPEEARTMGKRAQNISRTHFSPGHIAAEHLKIYREAFFA